MTLHEAIRRVLLEYGPLGVAEIVAKVNENNLYQRADEMPVPASQVSARVSRYPHMFIKREGIVYFNEVIMLDAQVCGYFGTSYSVKIDIEDKKATYTATQMSEQMEKTKEIDLLPYNNSNLKWIAYGL